MLIPKKIEPSPIVDFIIDIRFLPIPPPDAVFGIVHNLIHKKYSTITKLPILQVPDEIRNNDPNLIYQPYYRFKNELFVLQIGPRILAISTPLQYPGWNTVYSEAMEIITLFNDASLIKSLHRLGMRYVNFFEENILDNSKLSLSLQGENLSKKKTFLRTELINEGYKSLLQVSNSSRINDREGSIIDIDTFVDNFDSDSNIVSNMEKFLPESHSLSKEIFFNLLEEKFLGQFNPQFDNK